MVQSARVLRRLNPLKNELVILAAETPDNLAGLAVDLGQLR